MELWWLLVSLERMRDVDVVYASLNLPSARSAFVLSTSMDRHEGQDAMTIVISCRAWSASRRLGSGKGGNCNCKEGEVAVEVDVGLGSRSVLA